jgi:hypothetical protein
MMQKLNKIQIANIFGGTYYNCKCYFETTPTGNLLLEGGSRAAATACAAHCCSSFYTEWSTMPAHLNEITSAPPQHHSCQRGPRVVIPYALVSPITV